MKYKKHSESSKLKISNAMLGKKKPINIKIKT